MEFHELIEKRYSCKKFDGRPLEPEVLQAILEAGRLSPTAKNLQEQRIHVARSPEALAKIDAVTPCRYGASTVLVVAYDTRNVFTYPGGRMTSGAEDATIVATHMMLAAEALGVRSCWLNRFDPDQAREILDLPEEEEVVMLLDLGYAAPGAGPLPNHSKRRPLSETVSEL